MSDEIPPPAASPVPPDDSAPLALKHTPAHGAVSPMGVPVYVKAKIAEAEAQMAQVAARHLSATLAERDASKFTPKKHTPLVAAIFVGIVGSAAPVLMMPEPKWNVVLAAVLMGAASSLATYFGMKSAGPKR